jgi:hypothetical protein
MHGNPIYIVFIITVTKKTWTWVLNVDFSLYA